MFEYSPQKQQMFGNKIFSRRFNMYCLLTGKVENCNYYKMYTIEVKRQQQKIIARNFSRAAASYDQMAMVQQEIGNRLFDRLAYIKLKPKIMLDLGSGTSFFAKMLREKYPNALLLNVDIAEGMLQFAKGNVFTKDQYYIGADAATLPLQNNSVDLIFSNCTLEWILTPEKALQEIKRILKPGGLL